MSAIADGSTKISGFPPGRDCARSVALVQALGVETDRDGDVLTVEGVGLEGLKEPATSLDAGNSGSTARMACGLLAPQAFDCRITGDASLSQRPFERVVRPLTRMGASLRTTEGGLPVTIEGRRPLHGIDYSLPVPSAQVKTAVLLAGLRADGATTVRERLHSRNHTEIALREFGVEILESNGAVRVTGHETLQGARFDVPGDFSSAAFFITAAAFLPGSELVVEHVGLNPTRTGLLNVLRDMGADIRVEIESEGKGEAAGNVRVRGRELHGTVVTAEQLPAMIDEIPVLAVAAAFADGATRVEGAAELRVKESDRLAAIVEGLRALGADVETLPSGFVIHGGRVLEPSSLRTFGDHRMVMAWAVASLGMDGDCTMDHLDQVKISYPGFWEILDQLVR